ncbi:MAG TPA: response regulator [Polyangiaceae bacterium]
MTTTLPPRGVGDRPLVWILDDSPMEAAMARRALAHACDVEVFSDGSHLIERVATGTQPDVIVLDLLLPGISGIEVCRFLRSRYDESALPILMLTVYGHKSDLVEGLAAGANDYVTKPYDAPELLARVSTLARVKLAFSAAKQIEAQREELLRREQSAREEIASALTSERAARMQAEAANQAKDGFLAMVSHELRTPLNAILGWTRLLRGGSLTDEKQARALETIERNAVAQTQLIEDLLDMSRIVGGKLLLQQEAVELTNVVNLSLDAVRPAADAKRIQLTARLDSKDARVAGDAVRLQQVVWNLLTNAIKFTPDGGSITVSLAVERDTAEIAVMDDGRGIDPAYVKHVFERFSQGADTVRRSRSGLGLGLAIVKHISELHGGSVSAESTGLGQGSTFRVRLPRMRSEERAPATHGNAPFRGASASQQRLDGVRVLLVDDDADALELLSLVFGRDGAEVLRARSAAEAYELLRERRPDVIVSDIGMPGEDGHDLLRRVRALAPDSGGQTPAIALTAFAQPRDENLALAAGFNAYFSKPADPAEIVASVASLAAR